jgi:hypothetical protein
MKRIFYFLAALLISAPAYAVDPGPGSDTWYIAAGDAKQCIAIPVDVVAATKSEWEAKGAPIVHHVLDDGGQSLTIFQGGDKMLLLYENEADCRIWLPVAVAMAQEQRGQ